MNVRRLRQTRECFSSWVFLFIIAFASTARAQTFTTLDDHWLQRSQG
jgi:hypothetical protein